jgi:hypothetical protein
MHSLVPQSKQEAVDLPERSVKVRKKNLTEDFRKVVGTDWIYFFFAQSDLINWP